MICLEDALTEFKRISNGVLLPTTDLMFSYLNSEKEISPNWFEIILNQLRNSDTLKELTDDFKDISFKITHERPIEVKVRYGDDKKYLITIPSVLKVFLGNYHRLILNIIKEEETNETIVQTFFPFFYCYIDPFRVALSSLPQVLCTETEDFNISHKVAHLQLKFLILHEISHIVLNHFDNKELCKLAPLKPIFDAKKYDYSIYKELEADVLAYIIMEKMEDDIALVQYSISMLHLFFNCMEETQKRIIPILNPNYLNRDGIFFKRFLFMISNIYDISKNKHYKLFIKNMNCLKLYKMNITEIEDDIFESVMNKVSFSSLFN